tara:strand:- start:254 stop:553 length:300 start_codon:yes stop_codon:yes gene_type:complete
VKKVLFIGSIIGLCMGQESQKVITLHKDKTSYNSKQELVQIGPINEFVLDQGHPFKTPSAFGYAIIQQGKLKEFILDQGYPSKIKPNETISNFKIIGEY